MKTKRLLGILLASVIMLGGCATDGAQETIAELQDSALEKPQTVEVVRGDMSVTTYQDAYVGPKVKQLTFEKEGIFGEYFVQLGDTVKEGDILATPALESIEKEIENTEEQIESLTNNYNYRKASLENSIEIAELELEYIYEQLESMQYMTPEYTKACIEAGNYDQQRLKLELQLKQLTETYELELPYYQKRLQELRSDSEGNVIRAPFDGTIVALAGAEYGDGITLDRYYVAVADTSVKYARTASISTNTLNRLQEVNFWIDGKEYETVSVPMDYDYYLETKNSNETAYSEFEILDSTDEISYGDYGKIKLVSAEKKDVLMLPETALRLSNGSYFVYMDVDGQYSRVLVKIGAKDGINVEILEGLEEGDVVYVQE